MNKQAQVILSEIEQTHKENPNTAHGSWIPAEFKIPGTDLIDQAIVYMCVSLNKQGFVSVTYMAEQVGLSRQSTSARVTKLEKAGLLKREEVNGRRMNITLTRKAWNEIKKIHQQRKAENQKVNQIHEEPAKQPEKPAETSVKYLDTKRQASCHYNIPIGISLVSKKAPPLSRSELVDFFSLESVGLSFTAEQLNTYADEHIQFCESVNGSITLEGFGRKLVAKQIQQATQLIKLEKQKQAQELEEEKRNRLEALTLINQKAAAKLESLAISDFSGAA